MNGIICMLEVLGQYCHVTLLASPLSLSSPHITPNTQAASCSQARVHRSVLFPMFIKSYTILHKYDYMIDAEFFNNTVLSFFFFFLLSLSLFAYLFPLLLIFTILSTPQTHRHTHADLGKGWGFGYCA